MFHPGEKVQRIEWRDKDGRDEYIERGQQGCVSLYVVHLNSGRSNTQWVVDINSDGETQLHNIRFMSMIQLVKDVVE